MPRRAAEIPPPRDLVGVRVAVVAPVPPVIVVPRDVEDRRAGEAVAQPVDRLGQRRVDVARDDRDVERRRARDRVPGVVGPVLVQVGKYPEPRHGGLLEMTAPAATSRSRRR